MNSTTDISVDWNTTQMGIPIEDVSYRNVSEEDEARYNRTLQLILLCPNHTETEQFWIKNTAYWLDGVTKTILAIIGIFLNIVAGYILLRPKMKNSFNLCLFVLNIIDTIFLMGSISESFKLRWVKPLFWDLHLPPPLIDKYCLYFANCICSNYDTIEVFAE